MGGLAYRLMKGNVSLGTLIHVLVGKRGIQRREALTESRQVGFGRTLGSPFGSLAFKHAAEFKHVFAQVGMAAHHVLPGIKKRGLKRVGHIGTPTLTALHHAFEGQLLDRFAQRRARDAKVGRQLAFRRQSITRLQRAFQNTALQRGSNSIGNTRDLHFIEGHLTRLDW